jgi:putative sigma-54 modulation protein
VSSDGPIRQQRPTIRIAGTTGDSIRAGTAGLPKKEVAMQITIKGHQIDVTPALRKHTESKMERLTRHFDHLHELSIVLGIEKLLHKAEATIHVSGKDLHADAVAPDMYAAIDALADKLTVQVRKHKEKLTNHHPEEVRAARYE